MQDAPNYSLSSMADQIAYNIIQRISNFDTWVFLAPDGSTPDGNNALMYSYGFAKAGAFFGYPVESILPNCLTRTTQRLIWQGLECARR